MSNKSESGFVRVKEKIPYGGKGVDELLGALRKILATPENKFTQKITLEVGAPHICIEKLVTQDIAGEVPKLVPLDSARAQRMEEYTPQVDNEPPLAQLWNMFRIIRAENLEIGHILIGDKTAFQQWLKLRIPFNDQTLFGIPLHTSDIPSDVFIVCGTPERTSDPEDVVFSVKGTVL